jgi:choline-sulfatase
MSRPNILVLIAEGVLGTLFRDGPAPQLHAPNLAALARRSRRFARAYAASPLSAPSRAAIMTGCLPSRTGVVDDGAEFPAAQPTFAHHLRRSGYRTILAGTMGFVGPDQLHGFETRLTADLAPADFSQTPDWREAEAEAERWRDAAARAARSQPAETGEALDFDRHAAARAAAALGDLVREGRPWLLAVGFAQPRPPFTAPARLWERYRGDEAGLPPLAAPDLCEDPHGDRLRALCGAFPGAEEAVVEARRGYLASLSALDECVGVVLSALPDAAAENTVVVFTAARGETLGARGLWTPMSLLEPAVRAPLMLAGPGVEPGRVARPASTLDIAPTIVALAGGAIRSNGASLFEEERGPAPLEYLGPGLAAPMVGLVEGCWKYVACHGDPPQLFDLTDDPDEATNLASLSPGQASAMAAAVDERWNRAALDRAVRLSQARRRVVQAALAAGGGGDWRHRPPEPAG